MTETSDAYNRERELIHQLNSASGDELAEMLRRPTPQDERVLRAYLGQPTYERMHALALQRSIKRGVSKLGNVVVIHGIMGGELTAVRSDNGKRSKVWLNYLQLALGRFMWFKLQPDGIHDVDTRQSLRATGMIQKYYGELTLRLSETWNAVPFWYDWRKDIYRSAVELQERAAEVFGRGAPFHIVAHSMGGLVARTFIRQNRDAWTQMQRNGAVHGGRLIMLGTPNYGSFAVPQIITGLEGIVRKLDFIDTRNDLRQYVGVANTFPGSYQMMPASAAMPDMTPLYEAKTWHPTDVPQSLLDGGRAFHEDIADVKDDWMTYIAGYGQHTLNGIRDWELIHEERGYTATDWDGDGRVPHKLGLLGSGRVFFVKEAHGELPTNDSVQLAAGRLLTLRASETLSVKGVTDVLPARRATELNPDRAAAERQQRLARELAQLQSNVSRARSTRAIPEAEDVATDDSREAEELVVAGWLGGGAVDRQVADVTQRTPNVEEVEDFRAHIEIAIYRGNIDSVHRVVPSPDTIAVGLYVGVRPDGAARALDRAVSATMPGAKGRFITQMLERGVIQAGLGQPFLVPDPRQDGTDGRLIALAGMGVPGRFGAPEATVTARELCWTLGRLGRRHLATVLIGSGAGNLGIGTALEAWLRGIARAQIGMPADARLQRITFVERDRSRAEELRQAVVDLQQRLASIIEVAFVGVEQSRDAASNAAEEQRQANDVPARVAFTFDKAAKLYRFGSITRTAALPEREIPVDRLLVDEANRLLALKESPLDQTTWGRFLERLLVPAEFRTALQNEEPLVMMLDDTTASIHWEMMAQPGFDDRADSFDPNAFLGTARGLTRQLRTTFAPPPEPPPPVRRRVRVLLIADPAADAPLPGAQLEGTRLAALFAEYNRIAPRSAIEVVELFGPLQATRANVMMRLLTEQFDVVHFAGHCFYDAEQPQRSGWIFGRNEVLTANEMNRIDRVPPFVFSNACESGITPDRATKELPQSFAEAFFARGVTNFVCTAWPISDEAATDFAVAVYSSLVGLTKRGSEPYTLERDTRPMWEAMRTARIALAVTGSGRLTWGAYQHYGNPYYRLISREPDSGRSTDGPEPVAKPRATPRSTRSRKAGPANRKVANAKAKRQRTR